MNRPTVMPIAIWIMDAATLKTIAFKLSVVVCITSVISLAGNEEVLTSAAPPDPLIRADAV